MLSFPKTCATCGGPWFMNHTCMPAALSHETVQGKFVDAEDGEVYAFGIGNDELPNDICPKQPQWWADDQFGRSWWFTTEERDAVVVRRMKRFE